MSGCDVQLWMFGTACKLEDEGIFAEIDGVNHLENEFVKWLTCHVWKGGCSTISFLVIVTTIIEAICCTSTAWRVLNCCCWWVVWKLKWISAPKTMHCFRAFSTAGSTVHFTLSSVLHYHITEVPNFLRRSSLLTWIEMSLNTMSYNTLWNHTHSTSLLLLVLDLPPAINGTAKIINDSTIPHVPVGSTGWFIICSSNHLFPFHLVALYPWGKS